MARDRNGFSALCPTVLAFKFMLGIGVLAGALRADTQPSAGMIRYPDVSQDKLVFCYADDLWIVDKQGGLALPLASPEGHEQSPRFNEDGTSIAFVGNYEGDTDLYEIPVTGGVATRRTYHPGAEQFWDWTPDGSLLYSTSGFAKLSRMQQLFTVSAEQPLPVQVSVPFGTNGAIRADGEWLAYTPYSRDTRTWKRYRGGMASDIWIFNLKNKSSRRVTEWEGTDSYPMWHGETLYYLSDGGPAHRLNIWKYDLESSEHTQVTHFEDFDVKYPSMGPGDQDEGEIVFQLGAEIRLLNLKSGKSKVVKIQIPGDRPTLRPQIVDASEFIESASISPNAKRVVVEARGDIWTLPAENGSPRNLTRSSGSAEREPVWSPDAKWIAFLSDATGEYELMLLASDGSEEALQLTENGSCYRSDLAWSPDSKSLYFSDKTGAMFVVDVESKKVRQFDDEPHGGAGNISWSSDSKWLAYMRGLDNVTRSQIRVFSVESGESQAITSGYFNDSNPAFDREGKYLYFTSNRDFSSPQYEDVGTTFIYDNTQVLVAVPLRSDVENLLLPKSDEEEWGSDEEASDGKDESGKEEAGKSDTSKKKPAHKRKSKEKHDESTETPAGGHATSLEVLESQSDAIEVASDKKDRKKHKKQKGKKKRDGKGNKKAKVAEEASKGDKDKSSDEKSTAVTIDFEGIESRCFQIPVPSGSFRNLQFAEAGLMYVRMSTKGGDSSPSIKLLSLKDGKAEEKTVVDGVVGFELTPDGKKMLALSRRDFYILSAAAGQKLSSAINTDGMRVEIDRRAEWEQIFHEAWRMERDFFYDPTMHGVDWEAMRDKYAELLDDCVSRYDLSFVIRELISELNVGHAYYREGDVSRGPRESVGLLGCQFKAQKGHIVFDKLWHGGKWDTDARNPLAAAGVTEGDLLLEVEGIPVDAKQNPYKYFLGRTGRAVSLQVQSGDEEPRTVVVRPMTSDSQLRFWDGIEATRRTVDKKSKGKVGYIYVTNTGIDGQNDLFRQFYSQQEKAALIIDDRWNGGGQIPTRFIELLNRPATNYWAVRDGKDWVWPPDSHQGPKCMLINGLAGSGGDMFPGLFKQMKIGKLIGRRTWGGLVGIQGGPRMVDGSSVTVPSFAYYEKDGTWGIEGHGVDPDIDVIEDPAKMQDGDDPQLQVAIKQMLREIKKYPKPPKRPAYPDRSGMGLPEADR